MMFSPALFYVPVLNKELHHGYHTKIAKKNKHSRPFPYHALYMLETSISVNYSNKNHHHLKHLYQFMN